ncbi:bifunctional proline dehydrogenase/L-glutamate gamma-semialdehyde dehydrogenase PutA [Pseudogemmobacter sp. W21_MBD1_M6]|uniref:bifunctional proline dehydrogenase/L-glutamate gamma-semialdehyde dehydrogenase PutA n=1 Tax=Pseudogemmobacter sp. W21_MBD1_M6 TaxID=3240271 RepID=UPI003F96DDC1
MPHDRFPSLRAEIDSHKYADEAKALTALIETADLDAATRKKITARAAALVRDIRGSAKPGLMEVFLAEYGLSTDEGVALMCLAEALLRVPDADTIDALIEDKIAPSDWGKHLGHSSSSLVNASTWALMLTGKVLDEGETGMARRLRGAVKRMGEPVIRSAVARAMKEMGKQFVLGENIQGAMTRAAAMEAKGYTYSYDMLGEAARTDADAKRYHLSYSRAISAIANACTKDDIRSNPGISVKLSALHPRYEEAQKQRVMEELVPRVKSLAALAKSAGMGFNIDAEEADRLSLSLDVIEAVLSDPSLAGWDGFGVVVQAYGPRAASTIEFLYALAESLDRRIMVRLVKGAYWDTEIKHAQVMGESGFPVFTRKPSTDVSYIANARRLMGMTDRIYPQFATHNAHTVAAVLEMATDPRAFEFQRLHGMGERLHDIVLTAEGTRCRVYAPVGEHRDLLAYLVRRLLENGANSSFVNQIVDEDVSPETVASDPFAEVESYLADPHNPAIKRGPNLYSDRRNSKGWDITHAPDLAGLDDGRTAYMHEIFAATSVIVGETEGPGTIAVVNPAVPTEVVGYVTLADEADIAKALDAAAPWHAPHAKRAEVLNRAADLFEDNHARIFAILTREAGKSLPDAIGELREAVDFLRYYANEAVKQSAPARGIFTCISPWNFPLAIFAGQIAAALAAGNGVLAKPAEQTPLIADLAVRLMLQAGVPPAALQVLHGTGASVGRALTSDPRIGGVAFTGSTATAQAIRRAMADNLSPDATLIAETGGLNAMIVDSTALPEQAVRDVVQSAFQSAGQRCSALRCLYVQDDIAENFTKMLFGAMKELKIGNPWDISTDVGPVIDLRALTGIADYITDARAAGKVLFELDTPPEGYFIAPTVIRVSGIAEMDREIFGPVLHIATFKAGQIDRVIADINATGYGLTFGLHTRIDDRVQHIVERIRAGNVYVNRNQIGAIVGSQPFGGEGMSGTGPKAGGPNYLPRFTAPEKMVFDGTASGEVNLTALQSALTNAALPQSVQKTTILPGPTGESNRLSLYPRLPILCLGPTAEVAERQVQAAFDAGGVGVAVAGALPPEALQTLSGFSAAVWWGPEDQARAYTRALAARDGTIIPLLTGGLDAARVLVERHVCVDTTASGGNAQLLAEVGNA